MCLFYWALKDQVKCDRNVYGLNALRGALVVVVVSSYLSTEEKQI